MTKPYFELELAVIFFALGRAVFAHHPAAGIFLDGEMVAIPVPDLGPGDALAAIKDDFFAECFIPYHTDHVAYGLTCHVFNKLQHEPAILEMLALQQAAPAIVERFRSHFERRGEFETAH